jgi:hypothetical protein
MAGESARDVAARSRAKAETLLRRAEMFERGAEGEALTASMLTDLPAEWTTLHDVRWPGRRFANIDHIVIGPAGIFVLDSKNWSGNITVSHGVLRQNGRSREVAVAGCADSALAVSELAGPYARHIFPVLCFVREDELAGRARDVMVCSTANVSQMLLSRPAVMSAAEVTEASSGLRAQLQAAVANTPLRQPPRPRRRAANPKRPVARRTKSRRRSSGPSLGRLLIGLALLLALVAAGPQLAAGIGAVISNQLTATVRDERPCSPTADSSSGNAGHSRGQNSQSRAVDPPC